MLIIFYWPLLLDLSLFRVLGSIVTNFIDEKEVDRENTIYSESLPADDTGINYAVDMNEDVGDRGYTPTPGKSLFN